MKNGEFRIRKIEQATTQRNESFDLRHSSFDIQDRPSLALRVLIAMRSEVRYVDR